MSEERKTVEEIFKDALPEGAEVINDDTDSNAEDVEGSKDDNTEKEEESSEEGGGEKEEEGSGKPESPDDADKNKEKEEESSEEDESKEKEEEPSNESLSSLIEEKTSGEFKDIDSLIEAVKKPKVNSLEEAISQAEEATKEEYGMSFSELMREKSLDYDKYEEEGLTDWDVVLKGKKVSDPDISEKELDYLENVKYAPLFMSKEEQENLIKEGKITETQIKALDIDFERELRSSKNALKERQKELKYPDVSGQKKVSEKEAEEQAKLGENIKNYFEKSKEVSLDIKDGDDTIPIKFELNEASKAETQKVLSDPKGLLGQRWANEDGSLNHEAYVRDIHILQNLGEISKAIYKEGASKGSENTVKDINNIDDKSSDSKPAENNNDPLEDQKSNFNAFRR